MFTGIVSEIGRVKSLVLNDDNCAVLSVWATCSVVDLRLGDSIAVNGVCLSAVEVSSDIFVVQVMGETLSKTTLGDLVCGDMVNLERCLKVGDRFDGHIVQGHVDGIACLVEHESLFDWERLRFTVLNKDFQKFLVSKGSVALDGVSLTVSSVSEVFEASFWFEVCLIPATLGNTCFGGIKVGDKVNVELDILAKQLQRLAAFAL